MSAYIELFDVVKDKDLRWISGMQLSEKMHDMINEEINQYIKSNPNPTEEEFNNEYKRLVEKYDCEGKRWSDGKKHNIIMISRWYQKQDRRDYGRTRRIKKYINTKKKLFSEYIIEWDDGLWPSERCLAVDSKLYAQGWFFTKRLFNARYSYFEAYNKKQAKMLMDAMIKKTGRGLEVYKMFMSQINTYDDNDNFILVISW